MRSFRCSMHNKNGTRYPGNSRRYRNSKDLGSRDRRAVRYDRNLPAAFHKCCLSGSPVRRHVPSQSQPVPTTTGIRTVTLAARVTHRSPLGFVRGPADIERQRCGCVPRTWPRIWSRLGLAQYGLTAIAPGANPSGSDAIGVKLPVAPMLYADTPFPTVVDPT